MLDTIWFCSLLHCFPQAPGYCGQYAVWLESDQMHTLNKMVIIVRLPFLLRQGLTSVAQAVLELLVFLLS